MRRRRALVHGLGGRPCECNSRASASTTAPRSFSIRSRSASARRRASAWWGRTAWASPRCSGSSPVTRRRTIGTVTRAPERATVGYLTQDRVSEPGLSILAWLSRQAGIDQAERELEESAHALAAGLAADDRYAAALDRLVAVGAGSFTARARATCSELGLGVDVDRGLVGLSGGEAARVALAAILLSRFDLLLLDEPTNDLDFDGLERLERFLGSYRGALVVVSHDREFLDRTVDRIASIEADTHRVREWAGGFSDYEDARDTERAAALADYEQAQLRRKELTRLLSTRRTEARGKGAALGDKTGGQDRRATHALQTKVRQAERLLERNELPPKPFEPWQLDLTLPSADRPSDVVLQLAGAVAERGSVSSRSCRSRPHSARAAVDRRAERRREVDAAPARPRRHGSRRWAPRGRQKDGDRRHRTGARRLLGFGSARRRADGAIRSRAGGGSHAARQVRTPRGPRRSCVLVTVARRAHASASRGAPGTRREPARPRRADEPPRSGGRRAARKRARGIRRDPRAGVARPPLPAADRPDQGAPAAASR